MRKLLVTAVALAPLAFAATASAQTVVDSNRTTPIATATADDGQPDDILVEGSGTITVGGGAAVTLNSDNDVTLEAGSDLLIDDAADGSAAIVAQGGNTGTVSSAAIIRVTDSIEQYEDDDDDGDLDGPFADGTDRYGIRVTGPGALDGSVIAGRGGAITVEGNQSYGIAIEGGLTGDLDNFGSISAVGDDVYGIRTTGTIEGDSRLSGTITATGEDAVGVAFDGDIGGALVIDAGITATGYRYPLRPSDAIIEVLDEDDLLIGGSAVRIAGDVGGGILLSQPPQRSDDDDEDEDDIDGDGVVDAQERTAEISSSGSAPALVIGSTTRTVTIGVVDADDQPYGLVNQGSISGAGLYDGVSATGARIGVDGGQAVVIEGGIRNAGAINAGAFEENATALILGAGASTPRLDNEISINAVTTSEGEFTATALLIEAGASLPSLTNAGIISAGVAGESSDAIAIRDASGSLSTIVNTGTIATQISRTVEDGDTGSEPVTGQQVALDLSANTTGITFTQFGELDDPDSNAADDDGDGVANVDEPRTVGNIRLGSGADTLDIRNGTVVGGINFGAGSDRLVITGGAEVFGGITDTDGQLQIDITDGALDARQNGATTISDLTVGAEGDLIVTITSDSLEDGGFDVTGTATFEDGAGLGVRFEELVQEAGRYSVVRAGTLEFGDIDQDSVTENSPFLFVVEADGDEATGEVFVDVRRRTAEEADLIASEAAAFDSVYAALDDDAELLNLFLSQTDREGFIGLYEQLLPDHSGGPLLALASGVDAVTRALSGRNQNARPGETSAWVQEINFYAEKDQDQAYGFESEGFGIAGGVERGTSMGAFGVTTAFTSTDLEDPQAQAEELLSVSLIELGLYWRAQGQNWTTWARAAGGYASLDATREFVGGNGVFRSNESDWDGFTIAAAAGASYERNFGRYSVRPEFTAEYFSLSESSRTESGGGDGFDLGIDDRDSHLFATTAVLNLGMGFGENRWLRPELRIGWKQNVSFDGGTTQGRFLSGGPDFLLHSDAIEGGGPVIGFRMNVGNELGFVSIEGDAELMDDYVRYALLLRASFKF